MDTDPSSKDASKCLVIFLVFFFFSFNFILFYLFFFFLIMISPSNFLAASSVIPSLAQICLEKARPNP